MNDQRDRDVEGRPSYAGPRDELGRPLPPGSADALSPRVEPPTTTRDAIRLGAALFDQRRFFEAHEMFEHVWKSDELDAAEAEFWKAVTQVCVGLCHVQRANPDGACSVLTRAAEALDEDRRVLRDVDGGALADAARDVASRLASGIGAGAIEFPQFPIAR